MSNVPVYCDNALGAAGLAGSGFPVRSACGSNSFFMAPWYAAYQSRVDLPYNAVSVNVATTASAAPTGAPLVSTMMPMPAEGTMRKVVPVPTRKAPECPIAGRPPVSVLTLKP
ncbi:hypothetical protein D3C75_1041130 [compost metagenome]